MKAWLHLVLVATGCMVMLASCDSTSSASDPKKETRNNPPVGGTDTGGGVGTNTQLVGTWEGVSTDSSGSCFYLDSVRIVFSANGSFEATTKTRYTCNGIRDVETYGQTGTWKTAGSTISFTTKDPGSLRDTTFQSTYSISGSTLTVTTTEDGTPHSETFTKAGSAPAIPSSPTFYPLPGSFSDPQNVVLTCGTSGATIHYTLDGTMPNASSKAYTAPINVDKSTVIRAIAMKDGSSSPITIASYVIESTPPVTSDPIIGTWSYSENNTSEGYSMTTNVTFAAGGRFTMAMAFRSSDFTLDTSYVGTWRTAGGKLFTTVDGAVDTVDYSVSGKTLTVKDGTTTTFTRVEASIGLPTALSTSIKPSGSKAILGFDLERLLRKSISAAY